MARLPEEIKVTQIPSDTPPRAGFGESLDLSGDLLAVGSPRFEISHDLRCGKVSVFRRTGPTTWTPLAGLLPADPADLKWFGLDVAVGPGRKVVVGAPGAYYSPGSPDNVAGAAYVFLDGSQILRLSGRTDQPQERFGYSVAATDDFIAVGAPYHVAPGAQRSGAVYVFDHQGLEIARLTPDPATFAGSLFGYSVAAERDRLVAGSFSGSATTVSPTLAIFERRPDGRFVQAALDFAGAGYGEYVDVSGGTVFVSQITHRTTVHGVAVLRPAAAGWTIQDKVGGSLGWGKTLASADGKYLVVGDYGKAHLYRSRSDGWRLLTELSIDDAPLENYFGHPVGLSGKTAVAAQVLDGSELLGSVYVFDFSEIVRNDPATEAVPVLGDFELEMSPDGSVKKTVRRKSGR